jgi:hypothetical protein
MEENNMENDAAESSGDLISFIIIGDRVSFFGHDDDEYFIYNGCSTS